MNALVPGPYLIQKEMRPQGFSERTFPVFSPLAGPSTTMIIHETERTGGKVSVPGNLSPQFGSLLLHMVYGRFLSTPCRTPNAEIPRFYTPDTLIL